MEPQPIHFPQKLHFTCQMCGGCCRNPWHAIVTEGELARFKDYDWARTRPRFQDQPLAEPFGKGLFRLNHIGGACIFLDDDNLCAIHKDLGLDAKPRVCKQFPYYPVQTPEGIVASLDFACPTVIADKGAPIEEQGAEFQRVVAEAAGAPGIESRAMVMLPGALSAKGLRAEAASGVPLEWADYLALEKGLRALLEDEHRPLTQRLLLIDRMAGEARAHARPGQMGPWVEEMQQQEWAPLAPSATPPPISPLRQRALLAPLIAWTEDAWKRGSGARTSAASRVALAVAVVPSRRSILLHSASAMLPLAGMRTTRFAQDDPALHASVVRYLTTFIVRKALITGTSVLQGSRYLALCFGAIRWYSVARAVLAQRQAVEGADIHYAIRVVEGTFSHAPALRDPSIVRLLNLLFNHVAPARSLYPNPYPA